MRYSHLRAETQKTNAKTLALKFSDLKGMPGIVIVLYNSTFLKISVTVKGDSLVDSNCSVSL